MQDILFYATANETLATVRDYANAKTVAAPTLTRSVAVRLLLRLFAGANDLEPVPIETFDNIFSWAFVMDDDFNDATALKIVADNAQIAVTDVTETTTDPETEITTTQHYTEFSIPISNMNSEALAEWLGTSESKGSLIGELTGYDANGASVFVLQVKGFTIRNRLYGSGEPSENVEDYLTIDEARALFLNDSNAMKPYIDIAIRNSTSMEYDGRYYLHESMFFRTSPKMNVYARDGYRDANGDVKTFIQYSDSLKGWVMYKTPLVGMPTAEFIFPWIKTDSNPGPISGFWRKVSNPDNTTYLEAEVTARYNIAAQTY